MSIWTGTLLYVQQNMTRPSSSCKQATSIVGFGAGPRAQVVAPLRIISRYAVIKLGAFIPPVGSVPSHLSPSPGVNIDHVVLDHWQTFTIFHNSLGPPRQLHRHVVLGRAR